MSWAKRSKTGAERARCRTENDAIRSRCKPFSRSRKNSARAKDDPSNFDANEFDYIVEKLVVKRVPVALFATHDDHANPEGDDSRNIYSVVPPINSPIIYTSTNEPGVSGFGTRGTSKNVLRLANNNETFGREDDPIARSLDRFTALHPNLKESERPPKDPLNMTKSRRSLAEELSELAAKRDTPNDSTYERRNEIVTTGSVHTARSESSRKLPVAEEKPSSNRDRNVNSSCFPFGWKTTVESPVEEENNSDDNGESFSPAKNQNFTIAPVQVHYHEASSNLENVEKNTRADRCCDLGAIDGNSRAIFIDPEPSVDDLAGTMLRWKIMIKHRPPASPAEGSRTRRENTASKIPQLGKSLRDPIRARVYEESRKNKTKTESL